MKKLFSFIAILIMFSCNPEKESAPETGNSPGIQNANGNIPDTTNSINLTTTNSEKKDTVKKSIDSLDK